MGRSSINGVAIAATSPPALAAALRIRIALLLRLLPVRTVEAGTKALVEAKGCSTRSSRRRIIA